MFHATLAAPPAALLLDVSLKSLPLFAVAGLACVGLRCASAAARHALWLLVLAGLLCLPVFCALLPRWSAPVLPAARPRVVSLPAPAAAVEPQITSAFTQVPPPQPPITTAIEKPLTMSGTDAPPLAPTVNAPPAYPRVAARPSVASWVCLIWLAGTLLVLGRTLLGLVAASRLVRRCHSITEGPLVEAADAARQSLGLTRPLTIRLGDVAVPMTCGIRCPVVLLPQGAADWPADRLRAVLLHEAAHVKRLDWATMMFAQGVCALYWFHPLVWLAATRLRAESEGACDDLVLACGVPAPDYAAHLLEIVRGLASRRQALTGTVAMAHRREVSDRLRTILDGHDPRRGVNRRRLTVAALMAAALLAPLAALRPVASSPPRSKQHTHVPMDADVSPALAAMMAGRSRWKVRLPNGVRVRLLSVSESPAGVSLASTWQPDGTPEVSTQRAWPMPSNPGARACQFFWGIVFPADGLMPGASIWYGKAGEQEDTGGNEPPNSQGRITTGGNGEWFPVAQKQTSLQVSIATGPKEILIDAPANTGAVRHLPTGEIISVSPLRHRTADVAHEGGRLIDTRTVFVTVPLRFAHNISEYELQTIGADGKPFTPAHSGRSLPQVTGKTAHLLYTYRTSELLLNRMKGLRLTYRPSYTAVFRNIALRPAVSSASVTPISPLETGSGQPVQTISWEMTTHRYDASGRMSAAQPSRSLFWLRSVPPGLDFVDVSAQGEMTYQDHQTAGEAKTAQIVENNIRDFTSCPTVGASPIPPKIIGISTWHFSPWREKSVSLGGKQSLLFTRDIHFTSASHDEPQQQLIHVSRWFNPDSHRLIRGEQDVNGTDQNEGHIVNVTHDIRYNEPSPPGVFDGSLPPGAIFNGLSAHVALAVGFRRYVSRSLPDGTRYTFLYPSYFTKVGPSSPDTENSFDCADLGYSGTPVRWTAVEGGKIIAAHLYGAGESSWSAPHQELLEVIVGRAGDVPFPPGSRSIRRDIRRVGPNGSHHDISITDARTHFRFLLVHEDRDIPALFAQTDPVISSSFQILPPGTTVASATSGSVMFHVDLSFKPGVMVQRAGSGVRLTFFSSNKVFPLPMHTDTLKITSPRTSRWLLQDGAGQSLLLTDNNPRRVIVINRTEQPLTLVSHMGSPASPITLPPHSLMIVNRVLFPLTVSGTTQGATYVISMPRTKHQLPVTIIRAPSPQMNQLINGEEKVVTDLG